jgi:transposase
MIALLKALQINKSDRNDARGIAQMMRVGLFRVVRPRGDTSRARSTMMAGSPNPAIPC